MRPQAAAKLRVLNEVRFRLDDPGNDDLAVRQLDPLEEGPFTVRKTTIHCRKPSRLRSRRRRQISSRSVSVNNLGECLAISADGANDTTVLQMTDSSFTPCDNNGIQVTGNHATGNGVGNLHTIVVNIDNSTINGSRFYNLWVNDVTLLTNLKVRVQDSDLSVSSSGVAVAFDQQPTGATASAVIDLGGGALGSDGRNCIFGGADIRPGSHWVQRLRREQLVGQCTGAVAGQGRRKCAGV